MRTRYGKSMSSGEPGLIVLLLDQSKSMAGPFGTDTSFTKADVVADNVNRVLAEMCLRNTKDVAGKPHVKPRLEVAVIGYGCGPDGPGAVKSCWGGPLSGRDIVALPDLAAKYLRLQQFQRDDPPEVFKIPVWVDPLAVGNTPMGGAFRKALSLVGAWTAAHRTSYPPLVLNFTDGEVNDCSNEELATTAAELRATGTEDGESLLFNCHISSGAAGMTIFPASRSEVPKEQYAQVMFDISSPLPARMAAQARARGLDKVADGARGFAYNADMAGFVHFLHIGTIGATGETA